MAVMDADTGKLLNYRQLMRSTKYREAWSLSSANEFGRLANGIGGRIKNPTNTIEFIFQHEVLTESTKDAHMGNWCDGATRKAEPNRTRFTVIEGDRINYPGAVATPTAEMLVVKNALQQRNLHEGCTLHDNGHLKLVLHDTATPSQIHPHEIK
jgi:hypothetical protein